MNLPRLLEQFPNIIIANSSHNQEILDFYQDKALEENKSDIQYHRDPDFFSFLNARSTRFLVFLLLDEGQIIGIAVITYRNGYINGKLQTVGYLGDLRVQFNKKLIRQWRLFYDLLMKHSAEMPETFHCEHYLTALINSNKKSMINLVNKGVKNISYNHLRNYSMINVFGKLPNIFSIKDPNIKIELSKLDQSDLSFLDNLSKSMNFGIDWINEFNHRNEFWSKNNFQYLKIFLHDKLIGITSIWDPKEHKRISISKLTTIQKYGPHFLNITPFFQGTKPLSSKQCIDILYINQLYIIEDLQIEEASIVYQQLLSFVWKKYHKDYHSIAFCYFNEQFDLSILNNFIYDKLDMALYSVSHKEKSLFDYKTKKAVGFEISLV